MTVDCQAEIEALHHFFDEWFTGRLPATDEAFARCADALADDFQIVSPDGRISARSELLAGLRAAHGSRPPSDFRIWVTRCVARPAGPGRHLVTYEEWQRSGGDERGRTSTALLAEHAEAPGGLRWHHVHETWLGG